MFNIIGRHAVSIKSALVLSSVLCVWTYTSSAHGQEGKDENSIESLLQCDQIKNPEDRLNCFNALVERVKNKPVSIQKNTRRQAQSNQTYSQPSRSYGEADFGRAERKTKVKRIASSIRRSWHDHYGRLVVFLANGQIWREKQKGTLLVPKGPQSVKIKRGFFGGYSMKVIGQSASSRSAKAERLD